MRRRARRRDGPDGLRSTAEPASAAADRPVDEAGTGVARHRAVLHPPAPYGAPAAAEGRGSIVAPLLAGFSFALVGLVVQSQQAIRWPDLALFLLASAGVLLVSAVQFTFRARQYQVTPSEAKDWWPDWEDDLERQDRVYEELRTYQACHRLWVRRARLAYNTAICALLLGLAVVLVPRSVPGLDVVTPARLAAVAVVLVALAFELLQLMAQWLLARATAGLHRRVPLWLLDGAWKLASGNPSVRPSILDRTQAER
jgi:hypothetical protein